MPRRPAGALRATPHPRRLRARRSHSHSPQRRGRLQTEAAGRPAARSSRSGVLGIPGISGAAQSDRGAKHQRERTGYKAEAQGVPEKRTRSLNSRRRRRRRIAPVGSTSRATALASIEKEHGRRSSVTWREIRRAFRVLAYLSLAPSSSDLDLRLGQASDNATLRSLRSKQGALYEKWRWAASPALRRPSAQRRAAQDAHKPSSSGRPGTCSRQLGSASKRTVLRSPPEAQTG